MRYFLIVACAAMAALAANPYKSRPEPDAANVTENRFESTFFRFRYEFPNGWSAVNDGIRMAANRKAHEAEVKKNKAELPPDTPNTRHTFQVFWRYDLLIATPSPLAPEAEPGLPHITVWAIERYSMLDEAGDMAGLMERVGARVLRKAETVKISGRKFVRADFAHHDTNFEALFVTVHGKYLVGFELRGNSEQEINELAKTMDTLKYE